MPVLALGGEATFGPMIGAVMRSIAIAGDIYGHTSDATTRAASDGLTDALGLS